MSGPAYKWPLIIIFTLVTGLAAWTGVRLAERQSRTASSTTLEDRKAGSQAEDVFLTDSASRTPALPASVDQGVVVERCGVTLARANDPTPPLSVRSQPSPQATTVAEVANNEFVDVVGQEGDWFAVSSPAQGWVPKLLTTYGCNQKVARLEIPGRRGAATATGIFVGTGTHQYKLPLERGQRLTLTGKEGPMPQVRSPSNALLFAGPREGEPALWQGQLDQPGEYVLVMDSNFQGFTYAFEVVVE